MLSTGAKEVCSHLRLLFNIFGVPKELVSDRGTAFSSKELAEFLQSFKIKHRLVAVAPPWSNGMAERVNRFLKSSLAKHIQQPQDWLVYIPAAQYVVNNTYNSAIKATSSQLLLGYDQRNHTDKDLSEFIKTLSQCDHDLVKEGTVKRDLAVETTDKLRNYNKEYYDQKHRKPIRYNVGEYVMIRNLHSTPGVSRKFKSNYRGLYVIHKVLDKNRYVVKDVPGFNVISRPYNSILSPDKLKPWIKPIKMSS